MRINYIKKRLCEYSASKKWCIIIPIIVLGIILFISYAIISMNLNFVIKIIIIFPLIGIIGGIVVCHLAQNRKLHIRLSTIRNHLVENALGITLTGLFISIILLMVIYFHPPQLIAIEPKRIDALIPAGDSISRTISIKNLGSSDTNISIKTEFSGNWINIPNNFTPITSRQTEYINFSINIPLQTPLGGYKGAIKIYKNDTADLPIYEIPISLDVQPQAQFQATIDAPDEVNKTDYFKLKVDIKNVGASPVNGVNLSLNISKAPALDLDEDKNKTISLIPNGTELSREWWINVTNITDSWQTVQVNITSSNAGDQTVTAKINLSTV